MTFFRNKEIKLYLGDVYGDDMIEARLYFTTSPLNLKHLYLDGRKITKTPPSLFRFANIHKLFLTYNLFEDGRNFGKGFDVLKNLKCV